MPEEKQRRNDIIFAVVAITIAIIVFLWVIFVIDMCRIIQLPTGEVWGNLSDLHKQLVFDLRPIYRPFCGF